MTASLGCGLQLAVPWTQLVSVVPTFTFSCSRTWSSVGWKGELQRGDAGSFGDRLQLHVHEGREGGLLRVGADVDVDPVRRRWLSGEGCLVRLVGIAAGVRH